jgi:hypothetical protein
MTVLILFSCLNSSVEEPVTVEKSTALGATAADDCSKAKNTCKDYSPAWVAACPAGERCITLVNQCADPVALAYQTGCNGNGTPGAPQCNCANGPVIPPGGSTFYQITDADYKSCLPSWKPECLTAGLAILANLNTPQCASGTRVEFTAGNTGDPYGKFDSYNLAVGPPAGQFYSIPVEFAPNLTCANDNANHDCRALWCGKADCPDAYSTPTTGGCADGRSPQAGCQDTFSGSVGYTVTFCPAGCTEVSCPSCLDATPCK